MLIILLYLLSAGPGPFTVIYGLQHKSQERQLPNISSYSNNKYIGAKPTYYRCLNTWFFSLTEKIFKMFKDANFILFIVDIKRQICLL